MATKHDLDHLEAVLRTELKTVETRLDSKIDTLGAGLRTEFYRGERNQVLAIIGANTAVTALLLTAFRFRWPPPPG